MCHRARCDLVDCKTKKKESKNCFVLKLKRKEKKPTNETTDSITKSLHLEFSKQTSSEMKRETCKF